MADAAPMDGFLLPAPDESSTPFWEGCAQGELRVQVCRDCGTTRWPPRPMCPGCRSMHSRWEATAGTATVWSFVIPHPPLLPAYGEQAPYNVIVVTLDDEPGVRMVGNLVAGPGARLNSVDPHTISIGEPVRVIFEPGPEGITFPRWVRA